MRASVSLCRLATASGVAPARKLRRISASRFIRSSAFMVRFLISGHFNRQARCHFSDRWTLPARFLRTDRFQPSARAVMDAGHYVFSARLFQEDHFSDSARFSISGSLTSFGTRYLNPGHSSLSARLGCSELLLRFGTLSVLGSLLHRRHARSSRVTTGYRHALALIGSLYSFGTLTVTGRFYARHALRRRVTYGCRLAFTFGVTPLVRHARDRRVTVVVRHAFDSRVAARYHLPGSLICCRHATSGSGLYPLPARCSGSGLLELPARSALLARVTHSRWHANCCRITNA